MQSTVTRKNSYTLVIELKESSTEFQKARKEIITELANSGNIKGFRPWSDIPEAIIIRQYSEAHIESQALDRVINKLYPKLLKKENIIPMGQGIITDVKSMQPIEVIFEIEVLPEIHLDREKLDKIRVKKTPVNIDTEKEVEAELARIKEQFTHFHEVGAHVHDGFESSDRKESIEKGDRVTVSAQGYDKKDGDAITETQVSSYPLVIGSGSFIPGFEDELIGAKKGDTISFEITFPSDYHSPEFQGRKVYFTVDIEKIEKPHTPDFTEEFLEQLRGKQMNIGEFREILAKEALARHEYDARAKDEDELMKQMLAISNFDVWPTLLTQEIDRVYREHAENLMSRGYEMKQYLDHLRKSEEIYKDEVVKPEAERRLRAELILREIREIKAIEPTESEVKEEVEKIISQYSSSEVIERLRKKLVLGDTYYEDIKNRLAYRKVVDTFFE